MARLLPYTGRLMIFSEGGVMKEDNEMFCDGVSRRNFMKVCVTATAMTTMTVTAHHVGAAAVAHHDEEQAAP